MRALKSRSMSDEMSSLLPWIKCFRREGYRRARSYAMARHKASVVIVVDRVLSNRKHITCRCCSWSRVAMLAAKADFPTPGNPLIQMTFGPSILLISLSILVKTSLRVPSMHGSRRESLSPISACFKSSSSFFSTCALRISMVRSRSNLSLNASSLSRNPITFSFWESTKMYLTGANWSVTNTFRWSIHTHPAFQPSPNEVDYFLHDDRKFSDSMAHFVWDWNFLEPAELAREHSNAVCKAFHGFIGFLLSLQMLPELSGILQRWKQKMSQRCIRPGYQKEPHLRQDSATSSQTTYGHASQRSITLLIAVPRSMNIQETSLAEAERWRIECKLLNSTTISLICGSRLFRSMSWLYHCIWKGNEHNNNNDSVPRWPATAVIPELGYQISPRSLLRSSE